MRLVSVAGSGALDILPDNTAIETAAVSASTRRESYLNAIPENGSTQTR
jgi:hypothetical protein